MAQQQQGGDGRRNDPRSNPHQKPRAVSDGPPSIDKSPRGASPNRQIAQEPQQSTGLGTGQS